MLIQKFQKIIIINIINIIKTFLRSLIYLKFDLNKNIRNDDDDDDNNNNKNNNNW